MSKYKIMNSKNKQTEIKAFSPLYWNKVRRPVYMFPVQ